MTKAGDKIRFLVYSTDEGGGAVLGFVEQQAGGHWRAWDGVMSWGPIETQRLAICAVRANHEARYTEAEMKRQKRGQWL